MVSSEVNPSVFFGHSPVTNHYSRCSTQRSVSPKNALQAKSGLLDRLDGLQGLVERTVKLAILRYAPAQDRLEIREIRHIHNLVDALHESAHCVVGREAMADEDEEILAAFAARALDHCPQDRVVLGRRTLEIFVNDHDVVAVGLELEEDVFLEQTEVHL